MEVLLGGITSLFYGVADFLGGEAARKVSAATVVAWAGVIALPLLAAVAFIVGGDPDEGDLLVGLGAGVSGSVGLIALFAGLARGRAATVAPVSAALAAMVPVVTAVLVGDRPPAQAWVGVAVAVPAIWLSAWSGAGTGSVRVGLAYGALAGMGFGGFAAIIRFTGDDSGLFPLVTARAGLLVVVLSLAAIGVLKLESPRMAPRALVAGNSVLDVSANVTLLLALRSGSFALAAVSASFYPAVTVMLAKAVNGEHLRARQVVGVALTLVALGLIATR